MGEKVFFISLRKMLENICHINGCVMEGACGKYRAVTFCKSLIVKMRRKELLFSLGGFGVLVFVRFFRWLLLLCHRCNLGWATATLGLGGCGTLGICDDGWRGLLHH